METMTPSDLVARLEARARAVNLSMAAVCSRAKVAQSTITRWKAGKFEPRLRVLAKLDRVLSDEEQVVAGGKVLVS